MQHKQKHVLALPKHEQMRSQRNLARKIKPNTRRCRQRTRKLLLPHRRYRQHNPSRRGRQNLLPRYTPTLREDRPQALVPLNNVPQRSLQRLTVQIPAQPNRQRDRVRRTPPLQPLQHPHPTLRIRQRYLARTRLNPQRRTRRPLVPKLPHQTRYRRRLKQAADRDLNTQRRTHPADQTRRKQRMAPKRKEVVVNPYTLDPKHLRKQRAQNLLPRRPRRPTAHQPRHLRRRQCPTVELAVRRQRKTIQNDICRRDHVLGKQPTNMRPQLLRPRRTSPSRDHIRNQPLATPAAVLARNHRSLRSSPMPNQRSLDLPRLDPEAAHLHLRVRPTQKLQNPVRTPALKVPGAVHPAPRSTMRVRNKPLRRQSRSAQIAARQPRARNVQLPAHPSRNRLKSAVQYINSQIGDAASNQASSAGERKIPIEQDVTDMHGRFGDAVHVHEGRSIVAVPRVPILESSELQRLAAKDHVTQGERLSEFRLFPIRLDQLIEGRRSLIEDGDALARHQRQELRR